MKRIRLISSLCIFAVALCISAAYAWPDGGLDKAKTLASLTQQHKFTLQKSISLAEKHSRGRALRAFSDLDDQGRLRFHVHCLANDTILHVDIDGETGKFSIAEVSDLDELGVPPASPASGPSKTPAKQPSKAGPVTATLAELEFKGKQYLSQRIRIVNCFFNSGSGSGADYRLLLIQDRHAYGGIITDKERMADVLMKLKSGMTVNVEGVVVTDRNNAARYVLQCDKIEIVGSGP